MIISIIYLCVSKKALLFISFSRKIIFLLLLSACILLSGKQFFIFESYQDIKIQIKTSGEKNQESKSNEIWIDSIKVNNEAINLEELNIDNSNWQLNGNVLFAKPNGTAACLELNATNAKDIKISFYKNQYCGIVELIYDNNSEILDLFSNESTVIQHTIINDERKVYSSHIVYIICALGFVYEFIIVAYGITRNGILRNVRLAAGCEIAFLILISSDLKGLFETETIIAMMILIAVSSYCYMLIRNKPCMSAYFDAKAKILIIGCSIYAAFATAGHRLFLNDEKFEFYKCASLLLMSALVYPAIFFLIYLVRTINHSKLLHETKELNVNRFRIQCFSVMFLILLVISFGYYPGNMTSDGVAQWTGALGIINLLDNHPAIHTLFLRLCYTIYPSVYTAVIIHIILFCLLWTCFFTILYKKHIRARILLLIAIIISCCSNNYMSLLLISKNTSYALVILWNMILLMKMIETKSFWYNKWNILQFIIALVFLYTVRHNGFLGTYAMFLVIISYGVYNKFCLKKAFFIVISSVIMINIMRGPFYQAMGVVQIRESHTTAGPLISPAGMFIISDVKIPDKVEHIVSEIGTPEQWKRFYNPYNGDKLSWSELRENISKCSLNDSFKLYFTLLKQNPGLVIKDRLAATDLLWNVIEPKEMYKKYGVYNGRYITGIWGAKSDIVNIFPQSLLHEECLSDEHYYAPNKFTVLGTMGNKIATSTQLADICLYRNGIYIIEMMILIIFNIIEKCNKRNLIMVPPFITLCSLLLAASWQIYQYYWFFSISTVMFSIYCIMVKNNQ